MNVGDIMTNPAVTCGPGTNLSEVARLLWEHDCGAVPVVDRDGQVIGMLTDRDICIGVATRMRPAWQIAAGEVAPGQVYTCHPGDPLDVALATMAEHQVRRLPVIDPQGMLVGVLSINDVIAKAQNVRTGGSQVGYVDVMGVLKQICAHRRSHEEPSAASETIPVRSGQVRGRRRAATVYRDDARPDAGA